MIAAIPEQHSPQPPEHLMAEPTPRTALSHGRQIPMKPRSGGWLPGVATLLTVAAIIAGCGQSSARTEVTSVRVNQAGVGADWPFDGVTAGIVFCDPNHPSKALFHVTDTTGAAARYTDQIWALNGDEAYPLPPEDVWTGDVSVVAKDAPPSCH